MKQYKTFTLRLIQGIDQGMCPANCIDIFELRGDDTPLFQVTFNYGLEATDNPTASVRALQPNFTPSDLPFTMSGIDLIARVHDFVCLIQGDNEFFSDAFFDEGEKVVHTMAFKSWDRGGAY